jgi:hypothetical protein
VPLIVRLAYAPAKGNRPCRKSRKTLHPPSAGNIARDGASESYGVSDAPDKRVRVVTRTEYSLG